MRRLTAGSLAAIFLWGGSAAAQIRAAAPGGSLRGSIVDSASGQPVSYALVIGVGRDHRVFAPESGRFSLPGVGAGVADREIEADDGSILAEAFKNAERVLTLEKQFPFILKYQRVVTLLDSIYLRLGGRVDTIRKDRVSAFSVSDIAGEEFRKHHCFWYAGRDSVEGFPGYRIDFAPTPDTRVERWLLVDRAFLKRPPVEPDLPEPAPLTPRPGGPSLPERPIPSSLGDRAPRRVPSPPAAAFSPPVP